MQAKEKLASVAEEHGLTAEGLKDMAQEVGDAFSQALSEDQKHRGRHKADSPDSSRANRLRLDQADRPPAINPRPLGKPTRAPSEA